MPSVAQLAQEANNYEFRPKESLPRYIHTAKRILRQAEIYENENQLESAFMLYLRFVDLVINRLYKHYPHTAALNELKNSAIKCLGTSEEIKAVLVERQKEANKPAVPRKPDYDAGPEPKPEAQPEPKPEPKPDESMPNFDFAAVLRRLNSPVVPQTAVNVQIPQYPTLQAKPARAQQPAPRQQPAPLKPAKEFATTATTERNVPLRSVFLPSQLRTRFLDVADPNTRANLETCGILCGRLSNNAFFITHLVIPHQTSTSDQCTTEREEVLFEYVDNKDLFILGWIHTHPTQSCFMSSIDLHTQSSYQIMLPEAVALVCAPRFQVDWDAFRLTDPPGVDVIKGCTRSGFHPHDEPNIYKSAIPGHMIQYDFDFELVDLRST